MRVDRSAVRTIISAIASAPVVHSRSGTKNRRESADTKSTIVMQRDKCMSEQEALSSASCTSLLMPFWAKLARKTQLTVVESSYPQASTNGARVSQYHDEHFEQFLRLQARTSMTTLKYLGTICATFSGRLCTAGTSRTPGIVARITSIWR